ncbi:hypothetical protein KR054_003004 [Drosophila jambulina]|nr:hypothetical protein KR054_003004 [Drosophila jambulina]
MKFLTIFAFACVASFVVLHGVYGSPVPGPEPKPDPAPKAEPAPKPEPVANPKPVAVPNPANGPQPAAGGEGNFVALSANAEPMVPAPGTGSLKNDESLAI